MPATSTMMALMFIMALLATNWELFRRARNLHLIDLLAPKLDVTQIIKLPQATDPQPPPNDWPNLTPNPLSQVGNILTYWENIDFKMWEHWQEFDELGKYQSFVGKTLNWAEVGRKLGRHRADIGKMLFSLNIEPKQHKACSTLDVVVVSQSRNLFVLGFWN